MQRYRLGPETLQKVIAQCRSLQDSVGEILGHDVHLPTSESHEARGYANLDSFPELEFVNERHRLLVAIVQLAEHYPLGFCIEKIGHEWSCELLFTNGEVMELTTRRALHPRLIPNMSPLEVKTVPTREILNALPLSLTGIDECEETLLFRPTHDRAFLAMTPLPRPFLAELAEKTMTFLNRCFLP